MGTFDNPPAFPRDSSIHGSNGMSLRDWFAGQAMVGFFASTTRPTTMHPDDATWFYTIADAMLAERAKVQP